MKPYHNIQVLYSYLLDNKEWMVVDLFWPQMAARWAQVGTGQGVIMLQQPHVATAYRKQGLEMTCGTENTFVGTPLNCSSNSSNNYIS